MVDGDFRLPNSKNISEAIQRARKVREAVPQSEVRKYIAGFGDRLTEIIREKGAQTSWMTGRFEHSDDA